MAVAVLAFGQAGGGLPWLAGWLLCAAAYFAVLWRGAKGATGKKNMLFWFLAAEVLTDMVWTLIYCGNPGFLSAGVGLVYGLGLWLVVLVAAGIVAAAQNKKVQNSVLCCDACERENCPALF